MKLTPRIADDFQLRRAYLMLPGNVLDDHEYIQLNLQIKFRFL